MKRFGNLFKEIISFDNLLLAANKAQKGKLKKQSTANFNARLYENLFELQEQLTTFQYSPSGYKTFYIYDPKKRMISAAPYRDRIVHHALCNVIAPIFERTFIANSFANRKGKGTHKAILQYQAYAQEYPYVLKCDIRKFFPSIDHQILKQAIRRKIKCQPTLHLIDLIIDNSNLQEIVLEWYDGDDLFSPLAHTKGLPIGNLTSQFWANVYMNGFDHFVKQQLGVKAYIRYVDDFVLFAKEKHAFKQLVPAITDYLSGIRLRLHPNKTQIFQTKRGVPFLGFTLFPYLKHVQKAKMKRYKRYLRKQLLQKSKGQLLPQDFENSLNAFLGYIRFGESSILEKSIFYYIRQQRVNLHKHPSGSWRVLEQQQ